LRLLQRGQRVAGHGVQRHHRQHHQQEIQPAQGQQMLAHRRLKAGQQQMRQRAPALIDFGAALQQGDGEQRHQHAPQDLPQHRQQQDEQRDEHADEQQRHHGARLLAEHRPALLDPVQADSCG